MIFRRILAAIVDIILLAVVAFGPLLFAVAHLPEHMDAPAGEPPTPLMGSLLLWMGVALFCYHPVFESSPLQGTPGKLLMGLKVVRSNGQRLTFQQAFYRLIFGPLFLWFLAYYRYQFSGNAVVVKQGSSPSDAGNAS